MRPSTYSESRARARWHLTSSLLTLKNTPQLRAEHLSQQIAPPVQPRADGPDGTAQRRADLFVREALHIGEHHHAAKLLRQRVQRALERLLQQSLQESTLRVLRL